MASVDVSTMPAEAVASITKVFGPPRGQFFKNQHGTTHYLLENPSPSTTQSRGLIVLCHGLGTNLNLWDNVVPSLLAAGYTTLRYEYYNHGWSAGIDPFLKISPQVMLDQLSDLLTASGAESGGSSVYGLVGHSTGGSVAILAAQSLPSCSSARLALVSPALWANKPAIAKLADRIPDTMHWLMKKRFAPILKEVQKGYMLNCDVAFCKDPATRKHRYPEAQKAAVKFNQLLFAEHPYAVGGIGCTATFFLNDKLMPVYRKALAEVATRSEEGKKVYSALIFGEEDVVVAYNSPFMKEYKSGKFGDRIEVVPLPKLGHEAMYEDSVSVSKAVVSFFGKSVVSTDNTRV